jgi:hypothetical protein
VFLLFILQNNKITFVIDLI